MAVVVAFVPALVFLLRWGDRGVIIGRIERTRQAEELVSMRDNEVEALADLSVALARAPDLETAALPLVEKVQSLLDVELAGVFVIDPECTFATGVRARLGPEDLAWWRETRLDLHNEPSGVASAVFGAAPIAIYDVGSSRAREPAAGAGDRRAERGLGADPRERAGRRRPRRRIDLEKAGRSASRSSPCSPP